VDGVIVDSLKKLAVPLGSLSLDPRNARTHPARNLEALRNSLKHYGQRKPVVVRKADNRIIAGNGLWQAAKDLGWKEIAAVFVDDDEATATGYALMDNQSALLSEWDFDLLGELVTELRAADFDLDLTGFDLGELAEFADVGGASALEDTTYTSKIVSPVYEPKGPCPAVEDLYDEEKCQSLIADIDAAGLPEDVAEFLRAAATRHTVFRFRNIAEFYAHSSAEVQDLMEKSGLVIIDFNKAIEYGFVKLTKLLGELADREKANAE